jgi:F-type H+-transporting ATPase subunit gamma
MKNTQQITKAMKQVAAAKIRRAEMVQKQARPYAEGISTMLNDLMNGVGKVDHPFMQPGKAGAPVGVILMTADKGLAGAFNSNVVRAGEVFAREHSGVAWYPVGNKAINAVRRRGELGDFSVQLSGDMLETAQKIAHRVTDDFTAGKISEIVLVSARFVSMLVQLAETKSLVPIVAEKTAETTETTEGPRGAVEFAPSPEAVLKALLPKYLEFTLYSAMLETDASFYAAQLVAMSNATDNAGKLIDELTLQMNKARQGAITKEMLEIVGGAEALVG